MLGDDCLKALVRGGTEWVFCISARCSWQVVVSRVRTAMAHCCCAIGCGYDADKHRSLYFFGLLQICILYPRGKVHGHRELIKARIEGNLFNLAGLITVHSLLDTSERPLNCLSLNIATRREGVTHLCVKYDGVTWCLSARALPLEASPGQVRCTCKQH